jgi:hypothetical protein
MESKHRRVERLKDIQGVFENERDHRPEEIGGTSCSSACPDRKEEV